MKKLLLQSAFAALIGVGGLAATTTSASAYIACNGHNCWHTTERYNYHRGWGVRVHDDNWRWHGRGYRWREHEGRGYWRNGLWITF